MTDAEIAELLKQSQAFQTKFPRSEQEKMLKELPSLSADQKREILQTMVNEEEGFKKIAEEKSDIIANYEATLAQIVKDADKEADAFIQQVEQKATNAQLSQLDNQLNNI